MCVNYVGFHTQLKGFFTLSLSAFSATHSSYRNFFLPQRSSEENMKNNLNLYFFYESWPINFPRPHGERRRGNARIRALGVSTRIALDDDDKAKEEERFILTLCALKITKRIIKRDVYSVAFTTFAIKLLASQHSSFHLTLLSPVFACMTDRGLIHCSKMIHDWKICWTRRGRGDWEQRN